MEEKIYYIVWDNENLKLMNDLLELTGMSDNIKDQLMSLELPTGIIVVPYENGYSTYSGFYDSIKNNPDYVEVTEEDLEREQEKCEGCCHKCHKEEDESGSVRFDEEEFKDLVNKDMSYGFLDPEDMMCTYLPDEEYKDALTKLDALLHIRDEFRETEDRLVQKMNGFEKFDEDKVLDLNVSLLSNPEGGFEVVWTEYPSIFSFATEYMAQKFLEDYEDELMEVSEAIGYFM